MIRRRRPNELALARKGPTVKKPNLSLNIALEADEFSPGAAPNADGQALRRPRPISRREAVQWVMAAVAASALPRKGFAEQPESENKSVAKQEAAGKQPTPSTQGLEGVGYGLDPNLKKNYQPGDLWPLTFTEAQKKTATALADTIIPEDKFGPAASDVGVVEMVDEWISAPYPAQKLDRPIVLNGLSWLEAESTRRFSKTFADLADEQKTAICDDICFTETAKPEFKPAAIFFSTFRTLCAAAYYATPPGWKSIGYVGNVQLPRFDGPPQAVLDKLGLTQTVR
jgi:Gluconate 2-dehydrogenase subunit 3